MPPSAAVMASLLCMQYRAQMLVPVEQLRQIRDEFQRQVCTLQNDVPFPERG